LEVAVVVAEDETDDDEVVVGRRGMGTEEDVDVDVGGLLQLREPRVEEGSKVSEEFWRPSE
jgi:hypothetical protein